MVKASEIYFLTEKAVSNKTGYENTPESLLKPIGDLDKAITNTSTGDMLLFLVSLNKK